MPSSDYLAQVRAQYESLPYPPCDPADERKRLARTWLDDLPMINHYGFAGRQDFRRGFRALVAGGGTGDATIFLAEQLRDTDAQVVHVDFSSASIALAKERASIRGLENITWIEDSLLALPSLGLEPFDYVNCVGVLHHLAEPEAGLEALLSVRKPEGVLGIMVYGRHGRAGVYQMQELLRNMPSAGQGMQAELATAREVLASAPPTNWFKQNERFFGDHLAWGDAGLYDLLLHSQDRAYTVDEVYAWFGAGHGLHLELTDVHRGRSAYLPQYAVGPKQPAFLAAVAALPAPRQHAIAELLRGDLIMHTFYALPSAACVAPYGDPQYVPFLFHDPVTGADLAQLVRQHGHKPFLMAHQHSGIATNVDPGRYAAAILKHVDGRRSFGQIFSLARSEPELRGKSCSDAELFADFRAFFDVLRAIDVMLLRHRDVELPPLRR